MRLEDDTTQACVILGVIFLLSSICIVIKAIHDLAKKEFPKVLLPPIPEPCTSSRNETDTGFFGIVISYEDFIRRSDDPHRDSENRTENDRFTC
ncbi:hypothetical protein llap_17843 [Limosa lapponica baueri]|uniref:Uncharacterized protein n=1 Tax=Limosa lapponica baueri TaxID=1758121 RepID=A0A2I0TDH1_LIMLA|nr:hypothetical protein llap_17843 [Limosa lapponica baueri]